MYGNNILLIKLVENRKQKGHMTLNLLQGCWKNIASGKEKGKQYLCW